MDKISILFAGIAKKNLVILIFYLLLLVFLLRFHQSLGLCLILTYDLCRIRDEIFCRFSLCKMSILVSCCLSNNLRILIHLRSKILHIHHEHHWPNYLSTDFSNTCPRLQIPTKYEHPNHVDNCYAISQNIFISGQSNSLFLVLPSYHFTNYPQSSSLMGNSTFFHSHASDHF